LNILGIDPSTVCTGYSIYSYCDDDNFELIKYGSVSTDNNNTLTNRISKIITNIEELIETYDIDILVSEDQYGYLNTLTLKKLSYITGQLIYLATKHKINMYLYAPTSIKKIYSGKGNCSKEDMIQATKEIFDITTKDDNIADAIGCGYSFIKNPTKGNHIHEPSPENTDT